MRLKSTLLLTFGAGWLAMVAVCFHISKELQDQRTNDARRELRNQAALLSSVFDPAAPDLDRLVDEMARHAPYRITIITGDGRVVADSEFSSEHLAELENHADRTEILDARRTGSGERTRYSTSVGKWLMYSAHRLRRSDGFVRVAMPVPERRLLTPPFRLVLTILALVGFGAAAALLGTLRRTVTEPKRKIEKYIASIDDGQAAPAVAIHSAEELGPVARSLETLAKKVQARTQLLESEKNYLKAVLASMSEGVLIVDTRGRITRANPAFTEIFRIDCDPIGRTALEIVRIASVETGLAKVLREPETSEHEEEIKLGDRVLLARFSRLEGANQILGVVVVFHDITRLRRLENARRDFVSNLSHEFRTPLTSIRGYAETVMDEKCASAAHRDFLPKIHRNALQLSQMIDELFKLASLENGTERLEKQQVNLRALMCDLEKELGPRFTEKGVRFSGEIQPGAEVFLAREAFVRRILYNLLDNALKYTDSGEIKVSAQKSGKELIVAVADTGVGIPAEDLERIFERFYRVNKDRSRQTGGSGIGLAIVKHLVQVHGGRVWVESKLGRGSTFYFALPVGGELKKAG
ncbi:MAG: PAS domain-containing protein [Acidobacteria bacterium]|nr:MAG: PAS domain-containing protein [Acidobacteriota bacterium]